MTNDPTAPVPPYSPALAHRPTWRARALTGAAIVALCAGSGTAGAAAALSFDDDGPVALAAALPVGSDDAAGAPTQSIARVAAAVQPSVVSIEVRTPAGSGSGSGVVLREDGTILTNNHVIEGAADGGQITVSFTDGTRAEATILGRDPGTDLAVIRADGVSDLAPVTVGSDEDLHVGDTVLAIGSPLGLEGSVTSGIVSALNRPVGLGSGSPGGGSATLSNAIQTDAAVNPGNSGGALVDAEGRLVGINTAIATLGQGGASGSIGLGFAIPVDQAVTVAEQLIAGRQPVHAVIGVQVADSSDGAGAVLGEVNPGGPADEAGLEAGDVVTAVGERQVDDATELAAAVRALEPGDEVEVTLVRDGEEQTVTATLGSAST